MATSMSAWVTPAMAKARSLDMRAASQKAKSGIWLTITCVDASPVPSPHTARVGDQAAVEEMERPRDHARGEHVVDGEGIAHDRARIQLRPLPRRHRQLG